MGETINAAFRKCINSLVKRYTTCKNSHLRTDFDTQHPNATPEIVIHGYFYRMLEEELPTKFHEFVKREFRPRRGESSECVDVVITGKDGEVLIGLELEFLSRDISTGSIFNHVRNDVQKLKNNVQDENSRYILCFTPWPHEQTIEKLVDDEMVSGVNFAYVQALHEPQSKDDPEVKIIDSPEGWVRNSLGDI